ncbi:serine protease [Skermanella mucosa]|uniref:S1 family peptidase n=1 Tax=Skermanella mucosa TaxID=1789672 RepID=UPI00192C3CF5|nr:serine protease [Skermanella mucosa]UEM20093.1 serine protease [Skermanella mucosa]
MRRRITGAALLTALAPALGGCAGLAAPGALPNAARAETPPPVVICHEPARDLILRVAPAECRGRIIDEAEAAALASARAQRQRAQIVGDRRSRPDDRVEIRSAGSGFFINGQGQVLTGFHVVAHCAALTVSTVEGGRKPASVVASDQGMDLAVLQAKAKPKRFARFDPAPGRSRGIDASVVGYPALGAATVVPSRTAVEAWPAQVTSDFAGGGTEFSVEGRIRAGHSGSPVLDGTGRVIGMIRSKVDEVTTFRETGRFVDDVAQAVTNETIFRFLAPRNISYATRARGPELSGDDLLERAGAYSARVECWN